MTASPSRARRRTAHLLVAALLAAGCSSGSGSLVADDEAPDTDGTAVDEGGDAGTPDDQPPASFDEAIAAMAEVSSVDIELILGVELGNRAEIKMLGELDRDDVGTLTAIATVDEDMETEFRSDGDTVWISSSSPLFEGLLPAGATWVEADLEDLRAQEAWVGIAPTFDVLPVLRGLGEVEDAGTTEVGGDEVQLWSGDVDWAAARAAASARELSALDDVLSIQGDVEEFTVTVGLDGRDRVRVLELDVTVGGAGLQMHLWMDFTVRRLDHEVEAPDAPPAGETVPIDEVPEVLDLLRNGM
ncbi:MAG TPA: hypothetical protein VKZ72_11375 [Acidimicrobiales bacterium]|nr:hypothetical protein [Acidimicrobiales bacterium]